jgi:hypothetical protein
MRHNRWATVLIIGDGWLIIYEGTSVEVDLLHREGKYKFTAAYLCLVEHEVPAQALCDPLTNVEAQAVRLEVHFLTGDVLRLEVGPEQVGSVFRRDSDPLVLHFDCQQELVVRIYDRL